MKYKVTIPVETVEVYEVEAETEREAIETILSGSADPIPNKWAFYEADMDSNNWNVETMGDDSQRGEH